jgi:hypothetical protein
LRLARPDDQTTFPAFLQGDADYIGALQKETNLEKAYATLQPSSMDALARQLEIVRSAEDQLQESFR